MDNYPRFYVITLCNKNSCADVHYLPEHPSCLHCPDALSMVGDAVSGNGCGSPKSHVVIFTQFIVDD